MQKIQYFLFISFFPYLHLSAGVITPSTKAFERFGPEANQAILSGEIFINTQVKDFAQSKGPKQQTLNFRIGGLHPRNCQSALRKLSQYENFSRWIGFIDKSTYDEKKQRPTFHLKSNLLPFNMTLDFHLPRIRQPGVYEFQFDRGFLSGLKGKIYVHSHKKRCFFESEAYWRGPHSSIPSSVFEFFSDALGRLAMENLFRISRS